MSIKNAFLALLSQEPMHGYQLRQEFDRRTSGTWPLNIGQAYTTLGRMERDGLVHRIEGEDPERFELTPDGAAQLAIWWSQPVDRGTNARDELAIKLALAVTVEHENVAGIVQAQRAETMRVLHQYTRLKASDQNSDLAWSLVLDSLIFHAEAEVRWLDHIEGSLERRQAAGHRAEVAAPGAPAAAPETAAQRPSAHGRAK